MNNDNMQPSAMQAASRPIDILTANLEPAKEDKEISLETLSKKEIAKIMEAVKHGQEVANDYYNTTIRPKLQEREEMYLSGKDYNRKKFPRLSETSEFCSRDIKTTINWMLPSLEEPFVGTSDPIDICGVNINDDPKAKKIQQLLKYQLQRKNKYLAFIQSIWRDAMKLNWSVAKVGWQRDEERKRYKQLVSEDNMGFVAMVQNEVLQGHAELIEIKPLKEAPDLLVVTFDKITVKTNHPILQYMSPSELRFTPDGRSIQEAKFVAQRKIVDGDYLKRKERDGIYKDIKKAIDNFQGDATPDQFDVEKNKELPTVRDKLSDNDIASKPYELYESYVNVDYNDDGIYESLIVHSVGDIPIRIVENKFEMTPFFTFVPVPNALNAFNENEGYTDDLEQQQDLKTAVFRQIVTNVAKNNDPQTFINNTVDVDALINGDQYVLVDSEVDPSRQLYSGNQLPISPLAMSVIEYAQNEIEAQSGSTRYNQGLDASSLNQTAHGISAILGQAEKRMRQISRTFADNFMVPVIKYVIMLDQQYMDTEQLIRLADENVVISKEELDIDYDLIVNVGLGAGTKEAQIQYLMVLINNIYPQLQQAGLVTERSWYGIVKELLEKMGIRNIGAYILDPDSEEAQVRKQEMQQQAMAQQQAAMELEQMKLQREIEKARQPHITLKYETLPPATQAQLLQYLGSDVTTEDIMEREVLNYAGKNVPATTIQRERYPAGVGQSHTNR